MDLGDSSAPLRVVRPEMQGERDFSLCSIYQSKRPLTQDLTILGFDWRNNGGVEAHGEQTAQKICDV